MYRLLVDPDLIKIADFSKERIASRFGLKNCQIEKPFENSISFVPTFHWKSTSHIIVCEVSHRPFPVTIKELFADALVKDLPIKIYVIYPKNPALSVREFHDDLAKAKLYGIGLISVETNGVTNFERTAVSIPLYLPNFEIKKYSPKLRSHIEDAFEIYMSDGKPDNALQEIGQLIESIALNTAKQAKKASNFAYAGFRPPAYIRQSLLLTEMINESVINVGLLSRCKDFANDRNSVSHKPQSRAAALKIEKKLKENFLIGLKILEDFPQHLKAKGYKLKF